jgi:hypothetical protein
MSFNPQHLRTPGYVFGDGDDPPATDTTSPWTVVSLLKGILAAFPPGTPNPPVALPRFRPRVPANALGSPEDPRATDTTGAWSMISLLKGILYKVREQ